MFSNIFIAIIIAFVSIHTSTLAAYVQVTLEPYQSIRLREGDQLKITCTASGDSEDLEAVLFKDRTRVGDYTYSNAEVQFQEASASISDAGTYDCYGFIEDKKYFDHKQIKVEVDSAPRPPPPPPPAPRQVSPEYSDLTRYVEDEIILSCADFLPITTDILWTKSGQEIQYHRVYNGELRIARASFNDAGDYECTANEYRRIFRVVVSGKLYNCGLYESTCRNGECVPINSRCNNVTDCSDGSDEQGCYDVDNRYAADCDPTEKLCDNRQCKQKYWFCDGEKDCSDGSDEARCPFRRPGDACNSWEWQCASRQQCVLKGFICDESPDCLDGSDEKGCSAPVIREHPKRIIEVCEGETITINCRAIGFPIPYINWRLNWGHICAEPRCCTSNSDGYGILTVNNAVISDSGAYSCEAISNQGRVFAVDALVTVKNCPVPIACLCNNHANQCDVAGRCLNCQHNTFGVNCELCLPGYIGDARGGTPYDCRLPPTTTTTPRLNCDPWGTLRENGRCICKPGFAEPRCERCTEDSYFIPETRECIPCFCNGLYGATCSASNYYYNDHRSTFKDGNHGWEVLDLTGNSAREATQVIRNVGIFEVNIEKAGQNNYWFFSAPSALFGGNRLPSYGGNMSFVIFYEGDPTETPTDLEVRIEGTHLTAKYVHSVKLHPYEEYTISFPLREKYFLRHPDNQPITRNHLLMALSSVNRIWITASFVKTQYTASIRNFNFEIAKDCKDYSRAEQTIAKLVEICACPMGYNGTSCDSCASGYAKNYGQGQYLGLCQPDCEITCNGHSNSCDENECYDCQHNTRGRFCELCEDGYVGDATLGGSTSCYRVFGRNRV